MTNDPFSRAALAFWSLCAYPAFREGNRRSAYRLAEEILESGDCRVDLPCPDVRALVQGIEGFTVEPEDVEQVFRNAAAGVSPKGSER
jgi:prophage maintenance system killer protein